MKQKFAALAMFVMLTISCVSTASAAFIPDDVEYRQLNGQQQAVKTYTLLPSDDPSELHEESFEHDGYLYEFSDMTKLEQTYNEELPHSEIVTVNTSSKDLQAVLEVLEPSIEYSQDGYSGTLYLDHSTIKTEVAGYTHKNYTVTATKNYTGLDRNDTSYIDKTVVKDGRTLTLSNVSWSVESTTLVDDVLVPATYTAVATYSANASSSVATGYISTAEYSGTITASGISSIQYTVVFLGTEIDPEVGLLEGIAANPVALAGIIAAAIAVGLLLFFALNRKNVTVYDSKGNCAEYEKCGQLHLSTKAPDLDLNRLKNTPAGDLAIEVDEKTARKLFGKAITLRHFHHVYKHTVGEVNGQYWFKVSLEHDAVDSKSEDQEESAQ